MKSNGRVRTKGKVGERKEGAHWQGKILNGSDGKKAFFGKGRVHKRGGKPNKKKRKRGGEKNAKADGPVGALNNQEGPPIELTGVGNIKRG